MQTINESASHPVGPVEETKSSAQDRATNIKAIMAKSQKSYRIAIDILSKLCLNGPQAHLKQNLSAFLQGYESDHIRFLPKI